MDDPEKEINDLIQDEASSDAAGRYTAGPAPAVLRSASGGEAAPATGGADAARKLMWAVRKMSAKIPFSAFPDDVQEELRAFDNDGDGSLNCDEVLKAFRAMKEMQHASSSGCVPFSVFPEDARKEIQSFDDDGSGTLDAGEILAAFRALQAQQKAAVAGGIPIATFPEKVQEKLRLFDDTGDGIIDAQEVLAGVEALARERQRSKNLLRVALGLTLGIILLVVALGGMMAFVIDMTKDSKVGGSGVMLAKGTNSPVQTASAEMKVVNGQLQTRGDDTCGVNGNETCPATALETTVSTPTMGLSSLIDIEDLMQLDSMKISQNDATLVFRVEAVARYPDPISRYGSVVVIYTPLGKITLDGTAIFFEETMANTFSRAGLTVDTSTNRRLLGAAEVLGMFKKINKAAEAAGNLQELPSPLPMHFTAKIVQHQGCVGMVDGNNLCGDPAIAGVVDWTSLDEYGNTELLLEQDMHSMKMDGSPVTFVRAHKAQYPGQFLVEVLNTSHKLTYQEYKGVKYHCLYEETDSLSEIMNQRRALHDARRRAMDPNDPLKIDFLGFDVVDGEYCGHYVITDPIAGDSPNALIHMYEDWTTRKLHKITFGETAWVFEKLTELMNEDENPMSKDDVDMDRIWDECDPYELIAPPPIEFGLLTNTVEEDPLWGTPTVEAHDFVLNDTEVASENFLQEHFNVSLAPSRRRALEPLTQQEQYFTHLRSMVAAKAAAGDPLTDQFGRSFAGINEFSEVIYQTEEEFAARRKHEELRLRKVVEYMEAQANGTVAPARRELASCEWTLPACIAMSVSQEKMGLAFGAEYCHGKGGMGRKIGFSVDIDLAALQDYIKGITKTGLSPPMCPAPAGAIVVDVPFDDLTTVYISGSVTAVFPLGDCVELYGVAAGVPPQVGTVLEQLGVSVTLSMGVDLSTIDESCKDETKTTKMGKILFAPAFWGTAAIGVAPPMLQFENPIGAMMETDEDKKKRKEAEKKKAEEGPSDKWKTGLDFGRRSLDALVHPDDGSAPFYHLHSGGKLGKNMRLITAPKIGAKRGYYGLTASQLSKLALEEHAQRRWGGKPKWKPKSIMKAVRKVKSVSTKVASVAADATKTAASAVKDKAVDLKDSTIEKVKDIKTLAKDLGETMLDAINDGITVSATGWVSTSIIPTVGCPAKKQEFHFGSNLQIGVDVKVLSFEKNLAFNVVPFGNSVAGCEDWHGAYTYKTDNLLYAMAEVPPIKIGDKDIKLPCISPGPYVEDKDAMEYCSYHTDLRVAFEADDDISPDYSGKCREHYRTTGIFEHRHWPKPPKGLPMACALDYCNSNGGLGGDTLKKAFCNGNECTTEQEAARCEAFWAGGSRDKQYGHYWTCHRCAINYCNESPQRREGVCGLGKIEAVYTTCEESIQSAVDEDKELTTEEERVAKYDKAVTATSTACLAEYLNPSQSFTCGVGASVAFDSCPVAKAYVDEVNADSLFSKTLRTL